MIMKWKYLFLIPLVFGFVLFGVQSNSFAVTGKCVNCHTMHNSQGGVPMNYDGSATPNPILLRGTDCLGCHKNTIGGSPIANLDESVVPCVYTTDETQFLAGGNFKSMDEGTDASYDAMGHNCNVPGITNVTDDTFDTFGNVPGFTGTWDVGDNPLTCAGTYGCHGIPVVKGSGTFVDRWAGIKGGHHGNLGGERSDSVEIGTVGGGYRFLVGIAGYEDPNWQHPDSLDESHHNEYKGSTTESDTTTISKLCGRCHGNFHSDSGIGLRSEGSPWLRHPTDISLPGGTAEYALYGDPNVVGTVRKYSIIAPVGRTDVSAITDTVNPNGDTDDIVTCISCHRAHGTDQPDLLRWNYDDIVAGGGVENTGCFVCHTTKD